MVSGIALVPLYLKYIPFEVYGVWLATGNILMWLTAIDPGLSSILQQRISSAYSKGNKIDIHSYITSGIICYTVVFLLLIIIGAVVAQNMFIWFDVSGDLDTKTLEQAFMLAVVGSGLLLLSYAITSVNQGLQSSLGVGLIYVVVHVLDIVLILGLLFSGYGVLALGYSVLFRGSGMLIGNGVYLFWRMISEKLGFTFTLYAMKDLLGLVPFVFFSRASTIVSNNMDAVIVAKFLGVDMVPVLVLTRKVIDICKTLAERPAIAFMPAVSHLAGTGDEKRIRAVILRLLRMKIWLLALIFGGLLTLNNQFVGMWIGTEIFAGNDVNMLLCVGLLMSVITNSLSNLCLALGDIKGNSVANLLYSIVCMPLIVLGAKFFGLIGVVCAPIFAMLVSTIWYFPKSLDRRLKFGVSDRLEIFRELGKSIFSIIVPIFFVDGINITSWLDFSLAVATFSAVYIVILFGVSNRFRAEVLTVYRKWQAAS